MKNSTIEAVDTYFNGNISDFKKWIIRAHKVDLLDALDYYHFTYGGKNANLYPLMIKLMRDTLQKK